MACPNTRQCETGINPRGVLWSTPRSLKKKLRCSLRRERARRVAWAVSPVRDRWVNRSHVLTEVGEIWASKLQRCMVGQGKEGKWIWLLNAHRYSLLSVGWTLMVLENNRIRPLRRTYWFVFSDQYVQCTGINSTVNKNVIKELPYIKSSVRQNHLA